MEEQALVATAGPHALRTFRLNSSLPTGEPSSAAAETQELMHSDSSDPADKFKSKLTRLKQKCSDFTITSFRFTPHEEHEMSGLSEERVYPSKDLSAQVLKALKSSGLSGFGQAQVVAAYFHHGNPPAIQLDLQGSLGPFHGVLMFYSLSREEASLMLGPPKDDPPSRGVKDVTKVIERSASPTPFGMPPERPRQNSNSHYSSCPPTGTAKNGKKPADNKGTASSSRKDSLGKADPVFYNDIASFSKHHQSSEYDFEHEPNRKYSGDTKISDDAGSSLTDTPPDCMSHIIFRIVVKVWHRVTKPERIGEKPQQHNPYFKILGTKQTLMEEEIEPERLPLGTTTVPLEEIVILASTIANRSPRGLKMTLPESWFLDALWWGMHRFCVPQEPASTPKNSQDNRDVFEKLSSRAQKEGRVFQRKIARATRDMDSYTESGQPPPDNVQKAFISRRGNIVGEIARLNQECLEQQNVTKGTDERTEEQGLSGPGVTVLG